jgi:tetratricopeptide (TPR) repeat protein
VIRYAPPSRAFVYLFAVSYFCGASVSRSQQSPSPDKSSAPEATEGADVRVRFSQSLAQCEATLRSHPGNAQLSLRIGLLRGQAGDFAGAVEEFQHTLDVQPDFPEAHYNLGLALLANSGPVPAWKEALAQFEAAVALRPDYSEARRMAGVAFLESGDTTKAIAELKASLSLNPSSAEAHFDLGRALADAGSSSEACSEYLTALQLRSPYPDADNALATALLALRQNEAAVGHFNAALRAQPDFESAHYGLARALKAEGKTEESKVELKAASLLLQRQSDAVMSSHLSNESLDRARQGSVQAAIELAKKAVWLDPVNALANFNLGLLLADAGDLEASIHQLRKAISLAPFKTAFYLDLSRVQQKAGHRASAIDALRKAIEIDPADPALSAALKKIHEVDEASAPSSQSAADGGRFVFGAPSDTADGHFAFATQLSGEGDFVGAIGELRKALTFEPTRGDVRYSLAVATAQIGRYDEAEFELRNVLRLTPDSVPAHLALGSLLLEQNDVFNAAPQFREVLRIEPHNQQALKLLSECQPDSSK